MHCRKSQKVGELKKPHSYPEETVFPESRVEHDRSFFVPVREATKQTRWKDFRSSVTWVGGGEHLKSGVQTSNFFSLHSSTPQHFIQVPRYSECKQE